jgi:hypothetical protein
MRRVPNFYSPTEEDRREYRRWVRRVAVFYGIVALIAAFALTIRTHHPADQAAADSAAVASAKASRPR